MKLYRYTASNLPEKCRLLNNSINMLSKFLLLTKLHSNHFSDFHSLPQLTKAITLSSFSVVLEQL